MTDEQEQHSHAWNQACFHSDGQRHNSHPEAACRTGNTCSQIPGEESAGILF